MRPGHSARQYRPRASRYRAAARARLLNNATARPQDTPMTRTLSALAVMLSGAAASAECYADYKAKRDDPLRFHYGVAEIAGECAPAPAAEELAPRLQAGGWQLLNVVSTFDEAGLEERKDSAGENFLRF